MSNPYRGEIEAVLDGRIYKLCLTLGALAELEEQFGAKDLVAMTERLSANRISARDILTLIGCGLRGGGTDIGDEEVAKMKVSDGLAGYVRIAVLLLAATFGDEPEMRDTTNPPTPQDA
jgi:hypothetical protein